MARLEGLDFSKARAFGEKKHNRTHQGFFLSMNKVLIFSLLPLPPPNFVFVFFPFLETVQKFQPKYIGGDTQAKQSVQIW